MRGKWSEYECRENVKVTQRFENLVVYKYFDTELREERYAVVLEDTIMINSSEYPVGEIHCIADVYSGLLSQRKSYRRTRG